MAFGLRKLMEDSPAPSINSTASTPTINGTLSQVCEPFCDPLINDSGYCISPCLYLCPTNCHYPIPPDFPYYSPPPPPPPGTSNRRMSPLIITTFLALSLAVLIVLGYLIYVKFYRRGGSRGGRNIAQSQRAVPPRDDELLGDIGPVLDHPIWYIHTIGLQPSVISKITMCKYKRGEGLIEGTDCSVCLTEFEEDETLRLLPKCSHAFHVACIDTWLRSHTNCPNCRAPIVTSATQSPSPEPSNETSWDEIRLDGGGDDDVDLGREIESAPPNRGETEEEAGQEMEELNASRPQNELQPIRRSVSLDSLSAAKINLTVADFLMGKSPRKSGCESGDEDDGDQRSKRLGDSSLSVVRSVQFLSGPSSSMRRSLSWSGRFLGSKYGRNRSSLLPL